MFCLLFIFILGLVKLCSLTIAHLLFVVLAMVHLEADSFRMPIVFV